MDNVITGIDIGSDSIKIITANYIGKSFNILASTISSSLGIKRGLVVDHVLALRSLKEAVKKHPNLF